MDALLHGDPIDGSSCFDFSGFWLAIFVSQFGFVILALDVYFAGLSDDVGGVEIVGAGPQRHTPYEKRAGISPGPFF